MSSRVRRHIRHKLFIIFPLSVLALGAFLFFWQYYAKGAYAVRTPEWGVTFSTKYAKYLGLDWRSVYLASLDDLGLRLFRIPVYWDEIEPNAPDQFYLDDVQWMLDQAAIRDAKVLLTIGRRVPRWPECHEPEWAKKLSTQQIQERELVMIEKVVTTFKDHPTLQRWQVENEPFFSVFGECPTPDPDFIAQTIRLVKRLDPDHQIVITDSGELSTWLRTATIADVLGISMYRVTWNSFFGYFYYPLPPLHYIKKAQLIAPLVSDIIVTELQVEPWVPQSILQTPLAEQFRSMNAERFKNNIDYVRRTGFSQVYLWGIEWWYWLRQTQQDASMWNAGKELLVGN